MKNMRRVGSAAGHGGRVAVGAQVSVRRSRGSGQVGDSGLRCSGVVVADHGDVVTEGGVYGRDWALLGRSPPSNPPRSTSAKARRSTPAASAPSASSHCPRTCCKPVAASTRRCSIWRSSTSSSPTPRSLPSPALWSLSTPRPTAPSERRQPSKSPAGTFGATVTVAVGRAFDAARACSLRFPNSVNRSWPRCDGADSSERRNAGEFWAAD